MNLREELKKTLESKAKEKEEYIEFIIFRINDKWFGIELELATGVSDIKNYISLPKSPSYIRGIQFIHGNIIILFDILQLLENKSFFSEENLREKMIIIIKFKEDFFGVIVDDLIDTQMLPLSRIIQTKDINEFYKGAFKFKDKMVSILEIKKIIESTYNKDERN